MSDLIVISYADEQSGRSAFDSLEHLQKMQLLKSEKRDQVQFNQNHKKLLLVYMKNT